MGGWWIWTLSISIENIKRYKLSYKILGKPKFDFVFLQFLTKI